MVHLLPDLLGHLGRKHDALVAAFEIILAAEVGMLMEDDLVHVELIQVGIKQGNDDRFELHCKNSFQK